MLKRTPNPARCGIVLTPSDIKPIVDKRRWCFSHYIGSDGNEYERATLGKRVRWYILKTEGDIDV